MFAKLFDIIFDKVKTHGHERRAECLDYCERPWLKTQQKPAEGQATAVKKEDIKVEPLRPARFCREAQAASFERLPQSEIHLTAEKTAALEEFRRFFAGVKGLNVEERSRY